MGRRPRTRHVSENPWRRASAPTRSRADPHGGRVTCALGNARWEGRVSAGLRLRAPACGALSTSSRFTRELCSGAATEEAGLSAAAGRGAFRTAPPKLPRSGRRRWGGGPEAGGGVSSAGPGPGPADGGRGQRRPGDTIQGSEMTLFVERSNVERE